MSAIKKILSFTNRDTQRKVSPRPVTKHFETEKRQSYTPSSTQDFSNLKNNRKRIDTSQQNERPLTPMKWNHFSSTNLLKSKNEFENKNICDSAKKTKASETLPDKIIKKEVHNYQRKITILTREHPKLNKNTSIEKKVPFNGPKKLKLSNWTTNSRIQPQCPERSTASGDCFSKPPSITTPTSLVIQPTCQNITDLKFKNISFDNKIEKTSFEKKLPELKIKKPVSELRQKNPLYLSKNLEKASSKDIKKMELSKRQDQPSNIKSRSNDLIKKIFYKRSVDSQREERMHSEDKTNTRYIFKNRFMFQKNSVKYGVEKSLSELSDIWKNFYFGQLKKHAESSEEIRQLCSKIRDNFKESKSSILSDACAFKTTADFYKIKSRIGKGCFGEVYLATQILTGCSVALKVIPKITMKNKDSRKKIEKEVSILERLSHPGVIKLYEVFEDELKVYLVFEYSPNGDLVRYFEKNPLFNESELKSFFFKILKSIEHLHQMNVIHRDIKLDNILLDKNMNPKLCDFGISSIVEPGKKLYDTGGTPAYLAPEVIKSDGHICKKTDIWSLGVLLYLLNFGRVPFKANDMQLLYNKILSGKFVFTDSEDTSVELMELIDKMLTVDIDKRISLDDIFRHDWFADLRLESKNHLRESTEKATQLFAAMNAHMQCMGFSADYISKSLETKPGNHVKACFDVFLEKHNRP